MFITHSKMLTIRASDISKRVAVTIAAVICLVGCQTSKTINPLKPEVQGLVGKYYSIKNLRILASQNPQALWNYEVTMFHIAEAQGNNNIRTAMNNRDLDRYNSSGKFIDLNERPGEKGWGEKKTDDKLLVEIIDCDKVNAEVPLVKVRVLNKAYAGTQWWITGKDLYWGEEVNVKDLNGKH
jgi:hypothetical protein